MAMPDEAGKQLAQRLGRGKYFRRIQLEQERTRELDEFLPGRIAFWKKNFIRPLQHFAFIISGLHKKANREYLQCRVKENEICFQGRAPKPFLGFRILHLSDLHIDMDERLLSSLIDICRSIQYDICVMTGDYRNKTTGDESLCIEYMGRLKEAIKGEAHIVLGNHDFVSFVPKLEGLGYNVLLNESVILERDGARICIAGIDDPVIFRTHDIQKALSDSQSGDFRILLSHSPRIYEEAAKYNADLVLCGHTHGGQICLPGGIPIIRNDTSPRKFLSGRWEFGGVAGYTSNGCGASGLPLRLNCPPEAVVHILK